MSCFCFPRVLGSNSVLLNKLVLVLVLVHALVFVAACRSLLLFVVACFKSNSNFGF